MRSEMAQPCIGPVCSVRRIRRSRVPCNKSRREGLAMVSHVYNKPQASRVNLALVMTVLQAIEQNLHEHVAFLQRQIPGMIVEDREDLLLVDSGLPTDTFNKIARARL